MGENEAVFSGHTKKEFCVLNDLWLAVAFSTADTAG